MERLPQFTYGNFHTNNIPEYLLERDFCMERSGE